MKGRLLELNKWDELKVICPHLKIEYNECSHWGTEVCFGCDKMDFPCEYHKNLHCGHHKIFPFMDMVRIFKGMPNPLDKL